MADPTPPRSKLPVPGPWQAAVRAAIDHLVHRENVPDRAVAVTLVEPAPAGGLSVWLLAGNRTHRYRVRDDGGVEGDPDRP